MNFGVLRVTTPDGQTRDYPLDAPVAVIGRSPENSVAIDHISIARRHARLFIDSGNPYIEDLGSETGTSVGGGRLGPGERAFLSEDTEALLGEVAIAYLPPVTARPSSLAPAPVQVPEAAAPSPAAAHPLNVSVSGPAATVAAGSVGTATVHLQNRGTVVDEFVIDISDLPPGWVEVDRPVIRLVPGAREEVTIVLRPPKDSSAVAGDHPFSVAVTSREHGFEVLVVGGLSVGPFQGVALDLHPVRSSKAFSLRAENTGNTPVTLSLNGVDDEEKFAFKFETLNVTLKPGELGEVPFEARVRGGKKFGPQQVHPFKVEAHLPGAQANRLLVDGQLQHRPALQMWKWPVLGVLAAALLLGGGLGYAKNCSDQGWPGCGSDSKAAAAGESPASGGATVAPGGASTPPPAASSSAAGGAAATASASTTAGSAATTAAASAAAAATTAAPAQSTPAAQAASTPAPVELKGTNVAIAAFGTNGTVLGKYRQTSATNWVEEPTGAPATFTFVEVQRDDASVYLFDPARGVTLQLDLSRRKIVYSDATNRFDLYDLSAAAAVVKGYNVTSASFGSGSTAGTYRQTGPAAWVEDSASKGPAQFAYVETARDEWTVSLSDASRGVVVQLDLQRGKVVYSDAATKKADRYDIVSSSSAVRGTTAGRVTLAAGGPYVGSYHRNPGTTTWAFEAVDKAARVLSYTETGRDESSIYLADGARGVAIQIDVANKKLFFTGAGQSFDQFDIIVAMP